MLHCKIKKVVRCQSPLLTGRCLTARRIDGWNVAGVLPLTARPQFDAVVGVFCAIGATRQQRLDRRVDTELKSVVGTQQSGPDVPAKTRIVVERRKAAQPDPN